MAESALRLPFGAAAVHPAVALPPGVTLCPPAARLVLRGAEPVMHIAGRCLGMALSNAACRAVRGTHWSALWQGPDEQLLLGPEQEQQSVCAALEDALSALPHSLVDVSHRQIGFELSGAQAAEWLASGCPLDLALAAFPIDMATRTVFAKAEIVLWRLEDRRFRIEVWRSYAAYVLGLLAEAARP